MDRCEPEVSGKPIQYTPEAAFVSGEPCQLTISAIQGISKNQEQHANDVDPERLIIKQDTCDHTAEYAGDRDRIGRYTPFGTYCRDPQPNGTIEPDINPLLSVVGLQRSLEPVRGLRIIGISQCVFHTFKSFLFNGSSAAARKVDMAFAPASRQGAKLGQSLRSMI